MSNFNASTRYVAHQSSSRKYFHILRKWLFIPSTSTDKNANRGVQERKFAIKTIISEPNCNYAFLSFSIKFLNMSSKLCRNVDPILPNFPDFFFDNETVFSGLFQLTSA